MKYFTFNELTASHTAQRLGIDNTPDEVAINNLYKLVQKVLDPAREQLRLPISVNSGYRSAALNKAVGGVINSLHLQGRAADITTNSIDNNVILFKILQSLPHCELIWERGGTWIHVAI